MSCSFFLNANLVMILCFSLTSALHTNIQSSNLKTTKSFIQKSQAYYPSLKKFDAYGECNLNTCKNGKCVDANTCTCNPGYSQISNSFDKIELCNYKYKFQLITFLLELLFFFGLGHAYSERYSFFIMKFTLISFIFIFDFLTRFALKINKDSKFHPYMKKLSYFLYTIIIVAHSSDLLMIAINYYKDGNDFPLQPLL